VCAKRVPLDDVLPSSAGGTRTFMSTKWRRARERSAVWVIPCLYAVLAIATGILLPRVERRFWPELGSAVSASSATALYSAIASGTISLTAIVFSLTFVMVQFSATAYSPRLVIWLARDPVLSHALGVFTATFLYAVAALAWVDRGEASRVPLISAWMVIALLLASIGMFIALIQRIALLQIQRMLTFVGDRGREVIAELYPQPYAAGTPDGRGTVAVSGPAQVVTHHGRPCAVQAIDAARLMTLSCAANGTIEVLVAVGDTVIESSPLLRVSNAQGPIDAVALSRAIERGTERTFEQDPKYAIRLLVDIAIRALSPAINDPTTAVQALDQIGDLLLRLGRRRLEEGVWSDEHGTVRVIVPLPTWDDFVRLAFDEIRTYGGGSVQVIRRLRALMCDLIAMMPDDRGAALRAWQVRLDRAVAQHFADPDEQAAAFVEDRQGLGVTRRSVA
jgi:uncharacterized membrane protein